MSRTALLTDVQWARIEPLMPSSHGRRGRPFRDHRQVVEGTSTGCGGRGGICRRRSARGRRSGSGDDRFSTDRTWDRIHARLVANADGAGEVDWTVSMDSTINRAHQHAPTLARTERPGCRCSGGPRSRALPALPLSFPTGHGLGRDGGRDAGLMPRDLNAASLRVRAWPTTPRAGPDVALGAGCSLGQFP
jgi:transposase